MTQEILLASTTTCPNQERFIDRSYAPVHVYGNGHVFTYDREEIRQQGDAFKLWLLMMMAFAAISVGIGIVSWLRAGGDYVTGGWF